MLAFLSSSFEAQCSGFVCCHLGIACLRLNTIKYISKQLSLMRILATKTKCFFCFFFKLCCNNRTDSLLESASSGHWKNCSFCSFCQFHVIFIFQPCRSSLVWNSHIKAVKMSDGAESYSLPYHICHNVI